MSKAPDKMKAAPEPSHRLKRIFGLFDEAGVVLTYAEIVWLTELAIKADCPVEYGIPWISASPICYGGETFFPLTSLASHWVAYWQSRVVDHENCASWIYGFACTRSKPADISLNMLSNYEDIVEAVTEWFNGLAMQDTQLLAVYDHLNDINGYDQGLRPPDAKPLIPKRLNMKLQAISLCQIFSNTTPEYWISGISNIEIDEIKDALKLVQNSSIDDPLVDIHSKKNEAIHQFTCAVKWVRQFHGLDKLPPQRKKADAK